MLMTGEQTEGQADGKSWTDGQHSWSKMFTQQVALGSPAGETETGTTGESHTRRKPGDRRMKLEVRTIRLLGLLGQTQGGLYVGLIGDVVQEGKTGGHDEADEEVWEI